MLDISPGLRSRTVAVATLLMFSLVAGGWLLEHGTRSGPVTTKAEAARLFDEVFTRVYRNYVDSIGAPVMYKMAVDGMLYELEDPYTSLLAPDKLGRLNETTSGNYAGVGLQVDVRDGWIVVIAPLLEVLRSVRVFSPEIASSWMAIPAGMEARGRSKSFRGKPGTHCR